MSDTVAPERPRLLRDRSGSQRVTNIELFFDLVYVYAVTQLSLGLDHRGRHFAERCQAFILIALGESTVIIGTTLAGCPRPPRPG